MWYFSVVPAFAAAALSIPYQVLVAVMLVLLELTVSHPSVLLGVKVLARALARVRLLLQVKLMDDSLSV